jgi:putative colanic acid biosysnthesis UDP-glucose lipid carrier transferase
MTVRERILEEAGKETSVGTDFNIPHLIPANFEEISLKQYPTKRITDLTLSLIGLVLFGITYPVIALGIKLSSRGPVLFKQKRTGYHGHTFECYKFRTMHIVRKVQENGKPVITKKGDSRIFWFGSLIRQLNLDELPQVLNVLKGDMSMVGPRPYPVEECAYWNTSFDDFFYRYALKPGITGYAQVKGYRGGTLDVDHMRKRTDYDLIYVEKNSFWMDVKVIGKTIYQMISFQTNGH